MDDREIKQWLNRNYPELRFRRLQNGAWGIYQERRQWSEYDFHGFVFKNLEIGFNPVFVERNRLAGGWIKDEVQKRDPKLMHNEGNVFHQAWRESLGKDNDKANRDNFAKSRGVEAWNTIKKNPKVLNRIYKSLQKGDTQQAAKEVTLEEMAKNAYLENPTKMKDPGFKRAITERTL